MCGISAILTLQGHEPLKHGVSGGLAASLDESLEVIKHRGPDSKALGHVRLEINDLTPTGSQPLHSSDQQVHAVVNGEIYDYDRLRKNMIEKLGYQFKGTSDCELVLALYKYYGRSFLSSLRGEFAMVLYDEERDLFIAVRDRYGIKPLFWTVQHGQLLVAAEMKAFLPLGWKPEWDVGSIMDGGYQIGSRTYFKNVHKWVQPGHLLICRSGGNIEDHLYWDAKYPDKNIKDPHTEQEMIEGVRTHLYDSIRERLRADVKVGVSLSGGIDSSVVAGMVCQMIKEGEEVGGDKVTDRLTCFGIAFDEESGFDESDTANRTADFLGVRFHKKTMDEKALADRFEDATWICEQPCPDLNFIGCYALSELVWENGFRVLLNGQGSDEIFGGYPLFLPEYLRERDNSLLKPLIPDPYRQSLATKIDTSDPPSLQTRNHSQKPHQLSPAQIASRISSAYPQHPYPPSLLSISPNPNPALTYISSLSPSTLSQMSETWHPLHSSLYLFTKSNLPTLLLCNLGDRGEMAHSIEGRTPFLDHHLTEYVNGLPPSVKIRPVQREEDGEWDFVEKWVLREASRPYITEEVYGKRKHPYSAPVRWPKGGPLWKLLKGLVTRETVEGLGWIDWVGGDVGDLFDRAFCNGKGDTKGGDKQAWGLLLMIAQWIVIGERFGVETWKA